VYVKAGKHEGFGGLSYQLIVFQLCGTDCGNTISVTALWWQELRRVELKSANSNWYI